MKRTLRLKNNKRKKLWPEIKLGYVLFLIIAIILVVSCTNAKAILVKVVHADNVGEETTVPTALGAITTAPLVAAAPDGSHIALFHTFESDGIEYTYIARLTASSTHPYAALKVPGSYVAITFGPDATAYVAGNNNNQGEVLKVSPDRTTAEFIHNWGPDSGGVAQDARAIEYLGDHLYVETVARDCSPVTVHELDLVGTEVNSASSQTDCGALSTQAGTGVLSEAGRNGMFAYFDPDTLTSHTYNVAGGVGGVMGKDGSWTMFTGLGNGGQCNLSTHITRIDKDGTTLFDKPLNALADRCDVPGIAVLSDMSAVVGLVNTNGTTNIEHYIPATDTWQHITDFDNASQVRFATDNNGELIIAYQHTVGCGFLSNCEEIVVDVFDTTGHVSGPYKFGGKTDDSEILSGPISVDNGSIAVAVQRYSGSTNNGVQHDVQVTVAPVAREKWHDPAILFTPQPKRFVSFGDSVSYGFGLANATSSEHSGLPGNMPPSLQAYPSLLANYLGFTPQVRTTGCDLSGDLLAINGAPMSAFNANPTFEDCDITQPHAAVVSDELNAAHLDQNPPTFVIIQAGADDIHFGDCIKQIIMPWLIDAFVGEKCSSGSQVTDTVQNQLAQVKKDLINLIKAIKVNAPNVQIAVLDYYQVAPPSNEARQDGSTFCNYLYRNRKQIADAQSVILFHLNSAIIEAVNQEQQEFPDSIKLIELSGIMTDSQGVSHAMCTTDPWIFAGDGLILPNGADPDAIWRTAHPNVTGHQKIFEAAKLQLGLPQNFYAQ